MAEIQVPPPDHVHFDKQGRAYADEDRMIDTELARAGHDVRDTERDRLEQEVIKHLKVWRTGFSLAYRDDSWHAMMDALDALITFESTLNAPERDAETQQD